MSKWEDLNMHEKHAFIRTAVKNGIKDLGSIRSKYNEYADGGYKEPKHWKALQSVPHHVVADPNWNNNIETFVPNNVKRIWPNITDEELSKGYYKNNPYPGENTILYNPNDKTVDANTIALDGLHFMHDNPTYEDFYSDLVTSMRKDPELVFTSLMEQTGDDNLSRNITTKFIKGEPLTSEDKEYFQPAIDGYLRRQFAPDYMRGVKGGYDTAYKGDKSILDKTEAIRDLMEGFILPEVTVTPNQRANGGGLDFLDKPFSYRKGRPTVLYKDGGKLYALGGETDDTKPKEGETAKQFYERKNKEIKALRKKQEEAYAIPVIASKMITLTGNVPYKDRGATFSENLLDSIYINSVRSGTPFSNNLGLVAQESTLTNASGRGKGVGYGAQTSNKTWVSRNIGNKYSPVVSASDWSFMNDNAYNDALAYVKGKPNAEELLQGDINNARRKQKKMQYSNPYVHAFTKFDEGTYNPKEPDHRAKAIKRGQDIIKYSPEVQAWARKKKRISLK